MQAMMVDVLATARLVRLLRRDVIAAPLREALVREAYAARGVDSIQKRGVSTWQDLAVLDEDPPKLAELLGCSWCLGVWCAAGVAVARRTAPRLWDPLARVLAASFVATVIEVEADNRLA